MEISRTHYAAVIGLMLLAWLATASGVTQVVPAKEYAASLPSYVDTLPYSIGGWEGRYVPIDAHA